MAEFFARVELHGAQWPGDYVTLHLALEKHGFTNCIPTTNGIQRLPTGTYHSTGRKDDVVLVGDAIKKCADDTGYKNEVVVIKDGGGRVYLSRRC